MPTLADIHYHYRFERRIETFRHRVRKRFPAYQRMIDNLSEGGAVGVSGHPWRALDQWWVLDRVCPRHIMELGSGTSTGLFAEYVLETPDRHLLSLDESQHWAQLTQEGLHAIGLDSERVAIRHAERLENERGSYFDFSFGDPVDLLYVDGPSISRVNGRKLANQDAIHMLQAGIQPKAIMIDGRLSTVQDILDMARDRYEFLPSRRWIRKRGARSRGFGQTAPILHRHSVFLRRD